MDHNEEGPHSVRITARGPKAAIEIDGRGVDPGAFRGNANSHHEGESPQVVLYAGDYAETA